MSARTCSLVLFGVAAFALAGSIGAAQKGHKANGGLPGLVAVGKAAPEFALPAASGGRVDLREALRGKRALIVSFWHYS